MKEKAKQFVENCRNKGWYVRVPQKDTIITIGKQIEKENLNSFSEADSEYYYLLADLPITSPGSLWGTDGSGVGAISAMNRGEFIMNRSGVSKRFTKYVAEYLIQHPDLNIEI